MVCKEKIYRKNILVLPAASAPTTEKIVQCHVFKRWVFYIDWSGNNGPNWSKFFQLLPIMCHILIV